MADEKNTAPVTEDEMKEYKVVEEPQSEQKKTPNKAWNDFKPYCGEKKNKVWRIVGWVFGILLAVLILGLIFRDSIIENSVRHIGTLVTGTEVKIDSFRSSFKGTVELKNVKVANPKGYQKPYAFEVDRIYVKIDPATLTCKEPVVETVEVTGVRIDMEMKGASKSNLTDIQKNVERFALPASSGKKETKKSEPDPDAPAPLIKKIALTSMSISFSSSTLKSSVPVPLAPIYLSNVGGKGQPLGDTLLKIFDALMSSINNVGGAVMGGVEAVGSAGKAIGDGVADGAGALKKAGKSVGAGISEGVKNIGNIFKK